MTTCFLVCIIHVFAAVKFKNSDGANYYKHMTLKTEFQVWSQIYGWYTCYYLTGFVWSLSSGNISLAIITVFSLKADVNI